MPNQHEPTRYGRRHDDIQDDDNTPSINAHARYCQSADGSLGKLSTIVDKLADKVEALLLVDAGRKGQARLLKIAVPVLVSIAVVVLAGFINYKFAQLKTLQEQVALKLQQSHAANAPERPTVQFLTKEVSP